MALNLTVGDCDRTVPNCSDESGSDCSSEELIDCDIIVDVTTVTGTDDQNKIQTSPKNTNAESLKGDNHANRTKTEQSIVHTCDSKRVTFNDRTNATKDLKTVHDDGDKHLDKTSSIINLNPIGKHVNQTKNIGNMR